MPNYRYPQLTDLFKQRNPTFRRDPLTNLFGRQDIGRRGPTEGDIGPRPDIGPRYLKDDRPGLVEMFGSPDSQRLIPGRRDTRDRQGLSDPRAVGKGDRPEGKVTGGWFDKLRQSYQESGRPDKKKKKFIDIIGDNLPPGGLGGQANWFDNMEDFQAWLESIIEAYLGSLSDGNGDGGDDPYDLPDWLKPEDQPKIWPSGGEDTRMLPRGYGMDWFQDLLQQFDWSGSWTDPARRQETGGKLSLKMSANMLNIMNRIANQGVLGPEGRKFITSGDKRESQLRRKGLRKEMERGIGKQLGPRGGGAIENMLFNQLDAPDFARREGKAADLREYDMKSRMAGVEGLAQMLNFFEAMYQDEQTQAKGGPGTLQTIGDVGKIAASIAALL